MSTPKTTLLVLASTFPRWKNDTEPRFVYDLCQKLKNDYEVIVLSPHCAGAQTYEVLDGLSIFRYRYGTDKIETLAYEGGIVAKLKRNKLNWLMLPSFLIGQWIAIIWLLRKYPVKVIHAHWLIPQGILALAAKMLSKNKPALICTSHGSDLYSLNDPISNAIKRLVIKNSNAITVVSTAMKERIISLVPNTKSLEVIPMGTDLSNVFTPNSSVSRNKFQILYVGRLVDTKGHKYLLEALPKILEKHPKVILNIAGEGPEKEVLESQVEELDLKNYVKFLGRLSHDELVKQYRQSSLGVFPFIKEGLGLVIIEAIGCELPVVVSNIPAIHDIITDDVTGVIVPPADPQKIADKVIELLAIPEYSEQLAKRARQEVLKKFSWTVSATQYSSLVDKYS